MRLSPIRRYLKVLLSYYFGVPLYQPESVSLVITDKCNLRCKTCEYWNQKSKDKNFLSLQDCEELFSELAGCGVRQIQFTGGEPLLRPDLFSIFHAAKSNGLEITLLTNGTLINEKNCEAIVDLVDSINISLDSPHSEVHDSIRAIAGTFERATEAIRLLSGARKRKDKQVEITVCATISMMSLHNPAEMLALIKELGADRLIYNPASAGSYGYSSLKSDFANETMKMGRYDEMVDKIIGLMNGNGSLIKSNPFYLQSSKRFLRGDRRYSYFPCYSAGYNGPLVNYDGEVFPCCVWNVSLGNIREKPFSRIWKSERTRLIRKRIKDKDCPMCYHHTRTFDYIVHSPFLIRNPVGLCKGYLKLFRS
ncbi:MAG: radical SAM protein [Candidatus Omnitrophota bacterium]|nr:MAG: radical SAM protein [Candidatus Omnitrophota bacterium]